MITVMLTMAPDRATLEKEFNSWCFRARFKPMLIVAHRDMAFEYPEQKGTETLLHGVRIINLEELITLHGEQLGYKNSELVWEAEG